jgi:23S rRNA (adenine2503-C2)-methyltransferase
VEKDLKSKTFAELERLVVGLGEKKYLAGYMFDFVHTRGVRDVSEITPLSKSFRGKLAEQGYFISSLEIADKLTDPDGTVKYVFGTADGKRVESVLLFDSPREIDLHGRNHPTKGESNISRGKGRRTLCVSTQVGCAMGCVFCATGRLGLSRNLTTAEIVDQVSVISDCKKISNQQSEISNRITNVVFMGMGEPLANYDAVLSAVRILNHPKGKNIGIRHLTISTCGLPDAIERLADEDIRPRLAISLNAPTDAIRRRLMPIAKKYPLNRLLAAVGSYQRKTHNRVTFEYCMIKSVNDTSLHAKLLVKRLRGVLCNVNLIEYNPHKGCDLEPSGKEAIERFEKVLKDSGLETTVRQKFGRTINAACGQLGSVENLE